MKAIYFTTITVLTLVSLSFGRKMRIAEVDSLTADSLGRKLYEDDADLEMLLRAGANPNTLYGISILQEVLEAGRYKEAELLIEAGADLSFAAGYEGPILYELIKDDKIEAAIFLLTETNVPLGYTQAGLSTVKLAECIITKGDIELTKAFVEHGGDLFETTYISPWDGPVLMKIADEEIRDSLGSENYLLYILSLLDLGLDVNQPIHMTSSDYSMTYPFFHFALALGNSELLMHLMEEGAHVNSLLTSSAPEMTILATFIYGAFATEGLLTAELCQFFCEHGVDLSIALTIIEKDGTTLEYPLSFAVVELNDLELMKIFLANKEIDLDEETGFLGPQLEIESTTGHILRDYILETSSDEIIALIAEQHPELLQ